MTSRQHGQKIRARGGLCAQRMHRPAHDDAPVGGGVVAHARVATPGEAARVHEQAAVARRSGRSGRPGGRRNPEHLPNARYPWRCEDDRQTDSPGAGLSHERRDRRARAGRTGQARRGCRDARRAPAQGTGGPEKGRPAGTGLPVRAGRAYWVTPLTTESELPIAAEVAETALCALPAATVAVELILPVLIWASLV